MRTSIGILGLFAVVGLVLFPQVASAAMFGSTLILILAGFAVLPSSKSSFHVSVPLSRASESRDTTADGVRFWGQLFVPAGFNRRLSFEIETSSWTTLWVVAALSVAALLAFASSSVPMLLPLSPDYEKYPALYFAMYLALVPLGIGIAWFGERLFLRSAIAAFGTVQVIQRRRFARWVQYEFKDLEEGIRGSVEPAGTISDNDQLLLLFFDPRNPDKSKPALSLSFHHVRLLASEELQQQATSA
jgi:hypothetical protein